MELSQGQIIQKPNKQELSSLLMTYRLNVMHAPVKFHKYIPYGLGVMAPDTVYCMELSQGQIIKKSNKQELSSLFMTHRHNVIFFFFFFFFWFGFYGPFKNISFISSWSFIEGGRKPENPEKNHLTIRKQNLAFPHMTQARLEPQRWET